MLSEALCKQDCRSGPLSSGNEDPVAQTIGHLDQLAESLRTTWRSTTCEVKFASGDDLINLFDLMKDSETCSIADAFANAVLIPEAILSKSLSNTRSFIQLDTRKGLKRGDEDSVDVYP